MQTKLTLRMDDRVVAKAKRIAKLRRQSVSSIVEEHFKKIGTLNGKNIKAQPIPEWIQQLGINPKKRRKGKEKSYDELKYEYLKEKYLKD